MTLWAFAIGVAIGITLGFQIGLLLSMLFDRWSESAVDWIMRKYFGGTK